ncbi:MAG: acyl-CoA N-acyltransferase [Benniella sp.]|nr:MAG: acyl-CoA N-acyltransferase [Benniella sp.]
MSDPVHPPQDPQRSPEEYERLANLHDSFQPVWLTDTIQLGPLLPSDKDALIEYLNDVRIYQWLIGPPNPYKPEDADFWIRTRVDRMSKEGLPLGFVFRDMTKGGKAVGAVSVSAESDDNLEGDDTGYWLAPEYHGRGLMAKALKMMLMRISIDQIGKRKFNSRAFEGNWASRKTLEKVGFVYQPDIERTVVKDGKEIKLWTVRWILTEEDVANLEPIAEATPQPSLLVTKAL